MNVLTSLAVLGFLILFHEAGHFLAATSQGIKVNGFSIGFGPAILKKDINGITYAIRALPLGGFVSFPDEETNKEEDNDPNLLKNRPIYQRVLVVSAGVIANLFLAWIVLIGQAGIIGLPNQPDPGVLVVSVQVNEPASKAGLSAGDKIIGINGETLDRGQEGVKTLVQKIQNSPGENIQIERLKNDKKEIISMTPNDYAGKGRVGAQLQPNITGSMRKAMNSNEVFKHANSQFIDLLSRTTKGYKELITDFGATAKQLSGPVKIVEIGAQLSEQGGSGLVLFTALVSINLAVLNSIPLPLLDGGQLLLLILEGIRGKPIPEKLQLAFMQSGFVLLVGLSVVLIIRDTSQLNLVQQFINR